LYVAATAIVLLAAEERRSERRPFQWLAVALACLESALGRALIRFGVRHDD
jgi:hypothetical protein